MYLNLPGGSTNAGRAPCPTLTDSALISLNQVSTGHHQSQPAFHVGTVVKHNILLMRHEAATALLACGLPSHGSAWAVWAEAR